MRCYFIIWIVDTREHLSVLTNDVAGSKEDSLSYINTRLAFFEFMKR
ncbi:MAG: hypothetical protein HeimC3_37030 [Candidatus Heimdallarchaeota archaeon LC_3]|nr:MAG: hypothetical protein HeimC3_37030 [Candidatus Heimdallarchaeota archaeon LC_3]